MSRKHLGEARRDRETVAGKLDRGLEQLGPGQLAVFVVHELERGEHAGHADRQAAMHGGIARQRLAVRIEEELGRGGGRRGLAAVIAGQRLGGRVPIEHEGAAADAGGLRLDQVEHHLRGDAGIDCAPPLRSMARPASAASGWAATTMCFFALTRGFGGKTALAFGQLEGLDARGKRRGEREQNGERAPRTGGSVIMRRSIAGFA